MRRGDFSTSFPSRRSSFPAITMYRFIMFSTALCIRLKNTLKYITGDLEPFFADEEMAVAGYKYMPGR